MRHVLGILAALLAAPASAQTFATPLATTAVASSLIVRPIPGYIVGVNVTSGASAGFILIFDSATVPADGAVTPIKCIPLAANTGLDLNYRSAPLRTRVGTVVVFSTTGCFSQTASATAFISADYW